MKWVALAAAAVVSAWAVNAGATQIVTATYTGRVLSGFDDGGVFGNDHGDLTGDLFFVSFTFDAGQAPFAEAGDFEGGTATGAGAPSPLISVQLDVGPGGYNDTNFAAEGLLSDKLVYNEGATTNPLAAFYSDAVGVGSLGTIDVNIRGTPNSGTINSLDPTFSGTDDGGYCFAVPGYCGGFSLFGGEVVGVFQPLTFSVMNYPPSSETVSVPEPTTWALMLAGMFATGLMLRQKPQSATP
jgi:hypothetical protein